MMFVFGLQLSRYADFFISRSLALLVITLAALLRGIIFNLPQIPQIIYRFFYLPLAPMALLRYICCHGYKPRFIFYFTALSFGRATSIKPYKMSLLCKDRVVAARLPYYADDICFRSRKVGENKSGNTIEDIAAFRLLIYLTLKVNHISV